MSYEQNVVENKNNVLGLLTVILIVWKQKLEELSWNF